MPILTLSKNNCQFDPTTVPKLLQALQNLGTPHTSDPVQGLCKVKETLFPMGKKEKKNQEKVIHVQSKVLIEQRAVLEPLPSEFVQGFADF